MNGHRAPLARAAVADLLIEPDAVATWSHRVYDRIRTRPVAEADWRALFELGVTTALDRDDMAGLRAVLALAATYFDSVGDQFACLPYFEETMQRVQDHPEHRRVVLECTHDVLIGNS